MMQDLKLRLELASLKGKKLFLDGEEFIDDKAVVGELIKRGEVTIRIIEDGNYFSLETGEE
jgi:hypothetical protein